MEADAPSLAGLVGKLFASAAVLSVLAVSLIVLRKKNCTAEINVIWYAFSLIFVLWWCLHLAMHWGLVRLPFDENNLGYAISSLEREIAQMREAEKRLEFEPFLKDGKLNEEGFWQLTEALHKRGDAQRKLEELRRRQIEGDPWTGRYLYHKAKEYLTNTAAELDLVAIILIVAILPQLMNYVLSGFLGCAATPRYVWQFEKVAIWSLIKFLAAFGGIFVADALGYDALFVFAVLRDDAPALPYTKSALQLMLRPFVDNLLWGVGAVAVAFILAVFQAYLLEIARALGDAWTKKPTSWPYRVHRFFTRNLPREESKPAEEAELTTLSPRQIWERLTPAQQQEVGALVVRSLLEVSLAAMGHSSQRSTTHQAPDRTVDTEPVRSMPS
jgi:hypothetical protein